MSYKMQSNAAIQGIIFDLDGTLIDSRADIAAALNHSRVLHQYEPLSLEVVLPMVGHGLLNLVERGFADTKENPRERLKEVLAYYHQHLVDCTIIYPGVRELLPKLSRYKKAVVSNKSAELVLPILKQLGLASCFDIVIGGEDFPERKPHPRAAFHILEQWKLAPHEVLMVGDMAPDAEFAQAAGLPFAHCKYGYDPNPLQSNWSMNSFADLESLLSL